MEYLFSQLEKHWLEAFGTFSGLVYIFLSIRQNIWLWPIGIITSLVFFVVFFKATLYADSGLQLYYFIVSFYGWYHWKKAKNKDKETGRLKIIVLKAKQWPLVIIITLAIGFALYWIFSKYTDASHPMWDSMVTAGSITATWMLARKLLEQWLVWIIVDGASIALFLVKDLYFTSFLTFIYTIMAIWGFIIWQKEYKMQKLHEKTLLEDHES